MSILLWSAVLLAVVVVGFLIVVAVRKHYHQSDTSGSLGGPGFTLQDLRQMRREGSITEQQYEKLRAQIIGTVTADDAASAPPGDDASTGPAQRDETDHPPDRRRDGDGPAAGGKNSEGS